MRTREVRGLEMVLTTGALAIAVTGCASDGGARAVGPSEKIEASLAQRASQDGIEDPPEVAVERIVSLADWPSVYADCMTDAGFPTRVVAAGQGTESDIPSGQDEAASLADYTCAARYPMDPGQDLANLTAAQKRAVYAYLSTTLADCLEQHGHPVTDVPSEDAFLSDYGSTAPWNPFADIVAGDIEPEDAQRLEAACPPNPPPALVFGGEQEAND